MKPSRESIFNFGIILGYCWIICQWSLDSGFQSLVGSRFLELYSGFHIGARKILRIPHSTRKNFPDSGMWHCSFDPCTDRSQYTWSIPLCIDHRGNYFLVFYFLFSLGRGQYWFYYERHGLIIMLYERLGDFLLIHKFYPRSLTVQTYSQFIRMSFLNLIKHGWVFVPDIVWKNSQDSYTQTPRALRRLEKHLRCVLNPPENCQ